MKILKRGSEPKEKIYTLTCNNCKTKFQFRQHEGKVTHDQRDGDFVSIACPVCKTSCTSAL